MPRGCGRGSRGARGAAAVQRYVRPRAGRSGLNEAAPQLLGPPAQDGSGPGPAEAGYLGVDPLRVTLRTADICSGYDAADRVRDQRRGAKGIFPSLSSSQQIPPPSFLPPSLPLFLLSVFLDYPHCLPYPSDYPHYDTYDTYDTGIPAMRYPWHYDTYDPRKVLPLARPGLLLGLPVHLPVRRQLPRRSAAAARRPRPPDACPQTRGIRTHARIPRVCISVRIPFCLGPHTACPHIFPHTFLSAYLSLRQVEKTAPLFPLPPFRWRSSPAST